METFGYLATMDVFAHFAAEATARRERAVGRRELSSSSAPWPRIHASGSADAPERYPPVGAPLAGVDVVGGSGSCKALQAAEDAALQVHRGIYARLGMFRSNTGWSWGRSSASAPKARHMELQALYFDKAHHNLTSARMWWDAHKEMFDSREKLMSHAFQVVGKPIRAAARKTRSMLGSRKRSGSGVRQRSSGNSRSAAHQE
jgi:hypothetical protein